MTFWILASILAIGVALLIWRTVLRSGAQGVESSAQYDLEIYRDQLRELERDQARGLIGPQEAERARLEISRRVLEADKRVQAETVGSAGMILPLGIGLVVVAGLSAVIYINLGAPGYPDIPLAARIDRIEAERAARPNQAEAEAQTPAFPQAELSEEEEQALNALRARMERDSGDAEGWLLLARSEARFRNYQPALRAQERALEVLGDSASARVWVDLARMRILAAGGYISPEAEMALQMALARDPELGDARFLLGAMYQRQGRPDLAYGLWRPLLEDSDPNAPWIAPILEQIEVVAFFAGQPVDLSTLPQASAPPAATASPGPTQAEMDAAAELSAEDRIAMIEGMVARLNDRLATQGGTAQDWARLIGAYGVLGRVEAAQAVLAEAREVFAGDDAAMALFDEAAAVLPQGEP